jgi:hypothetical protein
VALPMGSSPRVSEGSPVRDGKGRAWWGLCRRIGLAWWVGAVWRERGTRTSAGRVEVVRVGVGLVASGALPGRPSALEAQPGRLGALDGDLWIIAQPWNHGAVCIVEGLRHSYSRVGR